MPHGQWVAFDGYRDVHKCTKGMPRRKTPTQQRLDHPRNAQPLSDRQPFVTSRQTRQFWESPWFWVAVVIALLLVLG